jgi:hypothetical protein
LKKLGKLQESLALLNELLDLETRPENAADLFPIKTEALEIALEIWLDQAANSLDPSVKYYGEAVRRGSAWQQEASPKDLHSEQGLAIQLQLAKANKLYAEFLKEKDPKDRLRMPEPYLTPQWRTALTTFLLGSVGTEGSNVPSSLFYNPQDQRRQDIQNGWWVIKKYNCMGCHQMQVGQRSVVMDLPVFAEAKELLPPNLSSEGARVDPVWLLKFLHDPSLSGEKTPAQAQQIAALPGAQPSSSPQAGAANTGPRLKTQPGLNQNGIRPYLNFRMPTFNFSPNELQVLVRFFMAMSGQIDPYIKEPLPPLTAEERSIARQMFTSGTPCLKCHVTGDPLRDAKAIAPNFLLASERLKPDWSFRWLLDPAQISPGTAMPTGLFKKDGERWVLPNPPPLATTYSHDHARLMVRYMFQMTADEQRALLATSPVATAAVPATQPVGELLFGGSHRSVPLQNKLSPHFVSFTTCLHESLAPSQKSSVHEIPSSQSSGMPAMQPSVASQVSLVQTSTSAHAVACRSTSTSRPRPACPPRRSSRRAAR